MSNRMYAFIEITVTLLSLVGAIYFTVNKDKMLAEIEQKKKEKALKKMEKERRSS